MKLAATCITYKRPEVLASSIESFLRQDWPQDQRELIVLDDADSLPAAFDVGGMLKTLTERLDRSSSGRVSFVLVGDSGMPRRLARAGAAAARLFETIELSPLTHGECKAVLIKGMRASNRESHGRGRAVRMADEVVERVCELSGGDPHLLQKLASSAFDQDVDDLISMADLTASDAFLQVAG